MSFDAANKLYEAGQFAQAQEAYTQLAKEGPLSANLYYNRGNAEWKQGNGGAAVAVICWVASRAPPVPNTLSSTTVLGVHPVVSEVRIPFNKELASHQTRAAVTVWF